MKNLYLMLIVCFLANLSTAQTNIFPASGNAGIGTTSPAASLDIYRSINFSQSRALKMFYYGTWGTVEYANAFRFIDIESTEGGKVLQVSGYGVGMGFDPPGISSPDKLYVNGRVGIGTNTPQHKLSIKESSNENTYVQVQNNTIGTLFGVGGTSLGLAGTTTNHDFSLYTNLTERMRVTASGDVGIGTSDTRGYKLAVAGNVIAESIRVNLRSAWPDYVFSKEYHLAPLSETEKHIKEKGHLPGIPSAAEVAANGVELGEINKKLLEKIEELTLHLIDQGKEIKELKDELKTLKKN